MPDTLKNIIGKRTALLFVFCVVSTTVFSFLFAQSTAREYSVHQKGEVIGNLRFYHTTGKEKTVLRLESHIQPRVLFDLAITSTEESTFENQILTFSSVYRCYNDKEKLNTQTRLNGDGYLIHQGNETDILQNAPIKYNAICLYDREPRDVTEVYSDINQKYLQIQRLGSQHYRIRFPDGNVNEYFYENDVCQKIIVHHPIYKATIELKR